MNRIEVLNAIWSRSRGNNVFLPMFQKGQWKERGALSVQEASGYLEFLEASHGDLYFTPLRYDGPRRRGFVGQPGVIFADLDGDHSQPELAPSVVIQSSPGHFHGYWFLSEPADPAEWEAHAKGWSQWLGADAGGWDITQVLRIPDSLNHKTDPAEKVTLVGIDVDRVYDLSQFPKAQIIRPEGAADRPLGNDAASAAVLKRSLALGTVPLGAVYWLTASERDIKLLGKIDRSRVMWQLERSLFEAGHTPDDVFHMMRGSNVNKWAGQDDKLWAEVLKAEAS